MEYRLELDTIETDMSTLSGDTDKEVADVQCVNVT